MSKLETIHKQQQQQQQQKRSYIRFQQRYFMLRDAYLAFCKCTN